MPWLQCTSENNELKNLLIAILDSETLSSSQSVIYGALIQGGFTFVAGLLALLAGYLAYKAATRKNDMEEERKKTKTIAYNHHILTLLRNLDEDIEDVTEWAKRCLNAEKIIKPIPHIEVPKEIESYEWENHALLPLKLTRNLYELYRALSALQKGLSEIDSNNLNLDDILKKAYCGYDDKDDLKTITSRNAESLLESHLAFTITLLKKNKKCVKNNIKLLIQPTSWRLRVRRFVNMIIHKQ